MRNRRVVTIDGPAGSGKSTTARAIAEALGWRFLDTGATYRAMTLALLRYVRAHRIEQVHASGGDSDNDEASVLATVRDLPEEEVATLLTDVRIDARWCRDSGGIVVALDGEEVPDRLLRAETVSRAIKVVADNPSVRARLVRLQRNLAEEQPVVTEGRDQGSVVFPDATFKFYFYASIEERARRRVNDALARGERADLETMQRDIARRDEEDRARRVGRLIQPSGAIVVNTTSLSRDEVVAAVLEHVRSNERELGATGPGSASGASKASGRYPVAGEEEAS